MLREEIQKIIERSDSTEESGHLICFLLEERFGLARAGAFNNDRQMLALLKNAYAAMFERVNGLLSH
jgi:hypothetical protein